MPGDALEIVEQAVAPDEALKQVLPSLLPLKDVAKEAVAMAQRLRVALEGAQTKDDRVNRCALPSASLDELASFGLSVMHESRSECAPCGLVVLVREDAVRRLFHRNGETCARQG